MNMTTVRDLIGDPQQWSNVISDEAEAMPEIDGAEIHDVFASGQQVAIYLRDAKGAETLSVFTIGDPNVREQLVKALQPGLRIRDVLETPL